MLRCAGCAANVDPLDPVSPDPFRCPNATRAPGVDHVLGWDSSSAGLAAWPSGTSINPFLRYAPLHHSYWLARARGLGHDDYEAIVSRLDRAIAGVDATGHGFLITPFDRADTASDAIGVEVWAKDETGNVAGSHKARHLMGLLLHLEVQKVPATRRLAIASCGNAALAAATLARAARRPLDVFVPPSADPMVLDHLRALHAAVTVCPRTAADPPGDPCVHRFRQSLERGTLPFCCQGSENGLNIDGGATIGQELADQLAISELSPRRLFVQVGGGALGSAVVRGLRQAVALGRLSALPALHFVQTTGAAPLHRAWVKVANRALGSLGSDLRADDHADVMVAPEVAALLRTPEAAPAVTEALRHAATHRSSYMWAWEEEPSSVAFGILDDETYDWLVLVESMLTTGGWPVVVGEELLVEANRLSGSGSTADETGTAGLAGLVQLRRSGVVADAEPVVVLFTGVRR